MSDGEKQEKALRQRWIEIQAKWLRRPAQGKPPEKRRGRIRANH